MAPVCKRFSQCALPHEKSCLVPTRLNQPLCVELATDSGKYVGIRERQRQSREVGREKREGRWREREEEIVIT